MPTTGNIRSQKVYFSCPKPHKTRRNRSRKKTAISVQKNIESSATNDAKIGKNNTR